MKYYSLYHINMMFSSIEEEKRSEVINKCYWPLLQIADKYPGAISIEAPGVSLEIINKIDPNWINQLVKLIANNSIEFVGSGYSQIIGPLVPAEINKKNQLIGIETYKELLGIQPSIALINEMAYSSGLVEHYLNSGYKCIIMEWNNPKKFNSTWNENWKYYPQVALGSNNLKIPLIWANCIAFQKFQRFVHNEYSFEEYNKYLKENYLPEGFFPLYSNDVEIFNYRPGRFKTEKKIHSGEWDRIEVIYEYIKNHEELDFVFPSDLLNSLRNKNCGNEIHLETPEQPIPVKKQEKYNINRWALTGRDDLEINSKCYSIYHGLKSQNINNSDLWKELCYLWASDFRTHITMNRWKNYRNRLDNLFNSYGIKRENLTQKRITKNYKGNDQKLIELENENIKLVLNQRKGLTIENIYYKKVGSDSLFGKLPLGYYSDISLGADFFSGHLVVERLGEHKASSLDTVNPNIHVTENKKIIEAAGNYNDLDFTIKYELFDELVSISRVLKIPQRRPYKINFCTFTFNVEAWDISSLYFATNNGGKTLEKFYIKDHSVNHTEPISLLITAGYGLGATEGVVYIGDNKKELKFCFSPSLSRLIPSIVFNKSECGKYFFRLNFSAGEIDETFKTHENNVVIKNKIQISLNSLNEEE